MEVDKKKLKLTKQKEGLKHLAVIMDGNGRWAKKKKRRREFGHIQGARRARSLIRLCSDLEIPYLSLFALSTENLLRPSEEVGALMRLLEKVFIKHSSLLVKRQIKLHIVGDISVFPSGLQSLCQKLCKKTEQNRGLNLIVALNYGGRQEILEGVQEIAKKIEQKKIKAEDLNEKLFSSFLSSSLFPPPDLIVRTGGESRLSNFYLWSSAYSEFYFTKTLWPDFDKACLKKALEKFQKTQRRYGLI